MPPRFHASLSLTAEPKVAGVVRYLPLAAAGKDEPEHAHINLVLSFTNGLGHNVRVRKITLSVPDIAQSELSFTVNVFIASGTTASWTQTDDYVVETASVQWLHIKVEGEEPSWTSEFTFAMAPHVSPGPGGCYQFWARADDLRANEFWYVNGTKHSQDNPAQLFAYDVGVGAPASTDPWFSLLLPGTDGSMNEHYRIWGKPIYAIGDGKVVAFRNDQATNAVPFQIDLQLQDYWSSLASVTDGNGNFFCITGGGETVLYAHMQPGTLNRTLLQDNADVKAGDFLGLAGNSGASSNPHMHIHAVAAGSHLNPWQGDLRPLLFQNLQTVAYSAITGSGNVASAPWSAIENRGFAFGDCAVWPLASAPEPRAPCVPRYFALGREGQLWIIHADGAIDGTIRTTSARMPSRGAYMGFDPGGEARHIAVSGAQPYIIGSDEYVREG
ncbi:MAG: M23 family metallopeptidase, partial [Chthoniobacterales bacterium]